MLQESMPTAHLLYGFLGAGKTTFAKKLESQLPAMRFSHDEWMVALYGTNPPVEKFNDYWMRVDTILSKQWKRALGLGLDIIIDEGLWSRARRDDLRKEIAALGANTKLYHITCAEETMRARVKSRNEQLVDSFYLDEHAFDLLRTRLEPLGSDEQAEIVRTD